eukprot:g33510.t1
MACGQDALTHFLKEEQLTGDERWRCRKCKKRVDAIKKIDLWKLPPVLVVHLKRFEFDTATCRFKKINVRLKTPLSIDLSSFVSSQQKERQHRMKRKSTSSTEVKTLV